jgi:hypothetical protein
MQILVVKTCNIFHVCAHGGNINMYKVVAWKKEMHQINYLLINPYITLHPKLLNGTSNNLYI